MFEGSNGFEGNIPTEIASNSGLKYMGLGKQTGPPVTFRTMRFLCFYIFIISLMIHDMMLWLFDIGYKLDNLNLTGDIPSEFGNLSSLEYLNIGEMTFVSNCSIIAIDIHTYIYLSFPLIAYVMLYTLWCLFIQQRTMLSQDRFLQSSGN